MSKAAELAALIGSGQAQGNKNFIINGDMQCWQRATAATTATSTYNTADRWRFYENSSGAYTSERSTDTPIGTGYSLKLQVTTADTSMASGDYAYFTQPIEAQNLQSLQYGTSSAKTLTLSFWVKSSKTGIYAITLVKPDTTLYNYAVEYTISAADTWEKKIITITPTAGSTSFITSSAGVIANDNGQGIWVVWMLASGTDLNGSTSNAWTSNGLHYTTTNQVNWLDSTSNNFYISQAQLEIGEVATPFEHRSFGDEYQRCLRYYYKTPAPNGGMSANETFPCIGNMDGSTTGAYMLQFPIPMRAAPTAFEQSGTASDYSIRVTSDANGTSVPTAGGFTAESALINLVSSGAGFTSGDACFMRAESTDAFLAFSAEL